MGNLNVSRRSKGSIFALIVISFLLGQISLPLQAIAFSPSNKNPDTYRKITSLEQVKNVTGQSSNNQDIKISQNTNTKTNLKNVTPGGIGYLTNNKSISQYNYVPGEVLVKYKKNKINLETVSGRTAALNFTRAKSLEKKEDLRKINTSVLRIKDNKTVEQKIAEIKNDPNVEYVQPNYQYYPTDIPTNDTYRNQLWALENTGQTITGPYGSSDGSYIPTTGTAGVDISAPEAWTISETASASPVIVAVIDRGVAYNHPDLINNMWDGSSCKDENGGVLGGCNHGYDYEDGDKTPLPTYSSHGTHIAGTIAAAKNNNLGIIGVAPNTRIMALKSSLTTSDNVKSINFAKQNGTKIINASWACYGTGTNNPAVACGGSYDYRDQAMIDAINNFNGLFITAAGNGKGDNGLGTDPQGDDHDNGQTLHSYPCDHTAPNIICVAATDQNDNLASFSDYGSVSVDVGAPGTNIFSAIADTAVMSENFENSPYKFGSGGATTSNWIVSYDGYSKVAYSDKYTPYDSNAYTWLILKDPIDLSSSNISGANLNFTIWCDTPSAPVIWQDYIQTAYYNGVWNNAKKYDEDQIKSDGGRAWNDSGYQGYYKNYTEDISAYLSNNFIFSFDWHTDSSIDNNLGCTVDDIKITKYTDGSDEKYDYYNGTSMAAPHVAGLAALIEGYNPGLTSSQVKNTILTTGDTLSSPSGLTGKTVTGKRINAQKALQAATPVLATITIDPLTVALTVGATHQLTATTLDQYGQPFVATLIWASDNAAATVSDTGLVTAVSVGSANITASSGGITSTATVTVTIATTSDKAITSFNFAGLTPSVTGAISGTDITLNVPYGTDVTTLVPTIVITGASVNPASGVAQDFTSPVTYTVTAEDNTTQAYIVTVTVVAPSNVATVTSATYTVSAGGTANETITNIPSGTSKATFLAALTKGQADQTWNDTGIADPVVTDNTLVVTAQDGVIIVTYTVTVNAPRLL